MARNIVTTVCVAAFMALSCGLTVPAFASAPTYSVSVGGGAFSPSPTFVPNSATATAAASLMVTNPNQEYQESGDAWTWSAGLTSYKFTKGGTPQPVPSQNAPSVGCTSGSASSTITLGTGAATVTEYYTVSVTATDTFEVTNNGSTTQMSASGGSSVSSTVASLAVTLATLDSAQPQSNTFLVGQGVDASATVSPSDLLPSPVPDGFFTWNVSSTTISYFSVTNMNNDGNAVPTGPLVLQNVHFYWSDPGQKKVTLQVLGQSKSVQATVTSPNASMGAVMKAATVDTKYSDGTGNTVADYYLHLGTVSGKIGTNGIVWTYNVDNSVGTYEMVQLVSETGHYTDQSGSTSYEHWQQGKPSGFPALDGEYHFRSGNIKSGSQDADSPAELDQSTWQSVTINASFVDYLMFMPSGGDSIWVPLGTISWSWGGTATNTQSSPGVYSGTWVGSGLTPTQAGTKQSFEAGSAYPSWSSNINDYSF